MKRIALSICMATTLLCGIVIADIRDPDEYFFHQSFGDLIEEVELAKEEGQRSIMIMFELNDCPWCDRMKAMILNQIEVQEFFREHFRIITLNVEGDNIIVDFAGDEIVEKDFALKHNRIRATPVFLFFNLEGTPVTRFTGAAKDVEEFMMLGEYVAFGHYEETNFIKFKRARKQQNN